MLKNQNSLNLIAWQLVMVYDVSCHLMRRKLCFPGNYQYAMGKLLIENNLLWKLN